MKTTSKENNFVAKRQISSIIEYKECLKKFSNAFEKEAELKTQTPIFLDTNVLLRYYSISFTAREKLKGFIKNNASRVILTTQIQFEFLKNREDVIQRFFEQVTNKIPKDFNIEVVNKMNHFLEQHKIVLKDYPFVEKGIQKHKKELEELLTKLNDNAEAKRKEYVDLIVNDDFLEILSECVHYDGLSIEEKDFIVKEFDTLVKSIKQENFDSLYNKPNAVFPGLGDIKNKPENPHGDFIIFHEMMKFMMTNKSDTIFLTFDNTKGVWMTKSKSQHFHYVLIMYSNTGQLIFILDAERTLGELLNVEIESLVISETEKLLSINDLQNLVKRFKIFNEINFIEINQRLVDELILNGYTNFEEVKKDFIKGVRGLRKYLEDGSPSNHLLAIRIALRIANPNYRTRLLSNLTTEEIDSTTLKKYKSYRKYTSL